VHINYLRVKTLNFAGSSENVRAFFLFSKSIIKANC